jgi:energy-coupling factor transport system ATP-binding protein
VTEVIQIEDLHYQYPSRPGIGQDWVLRGVDLHIQEGEFISILGATASGKSTLCLALNGVVPQSTGGVIKGQVVVDGLEVRRTPVSQMAMLVGLVFQNPEAQLFNLRVEEEVAFGLESLGYPPAEIRERMDWALDSVGLQGMEAHSPFDLSGGQKQRVAIAAVLAMTPKVLVLDEPTSSLDPVGKNEVLSVLHKLRQEKGLTIVLVEQDTEVLTEFSDRVAVLHEGRIADLDQPDKVFSKVNWLDEIGVRVPQMSRVARELNRTLDANFIFCSVEAGQEALEGFKQSDD